MDLKDISTKDLKKFSGMLYDETDEYKLENLKLEITKKFYVDFYNDLIANYIKCDKEFITERGINLCKEFINDIFKKI